MAIKKVYAQVAVRDLTAAVAWYTQLIGRPADVNPMDGLAEWNLVEGGSLQVFQDAERAGKSWVTVEVTSLDEQLSGMNNRGVPGGPITKANYVKISVIADPDGNHLTFAEALAPQT